MVDDIILSFQDSLLRKSDIALLQEGQWLNDKIIGFMFEYFECEQFRVLHNVLFVHPDVVQCIKMSQGGDVSMFLEPLQVETKTRIFLPINSHENPTIAGGTHWSLLVYDKQDGFRHYDSAKNMNQSQARIISKTIEPFLQVTHDVHFTETPCPQQTNANDCGVYVICVTEHLCEQQSNPSEESLNKLTPDLVRRKRQDIAKIIENLRDKR